MKHYRAVWKRADSSLHYRPVKPMVVLAAPATSRYSFDGHRCGGAVKYELLA